MYVIITALIFIVFLVINYFLFTQFRINISKELNVDCQNPIAIYFDKDSRDRCLTEKNSKKNLLSGEMKYFDDKIKKIDKNINIINQKINQAEQNFTDIETKVSPEINKVIDSTATITDMYNDIDTKIKNSQIAITDTTTNFENTINSNIQFAIDVGNNLVDNLNLNTYTPKWKDKLKKLVDSYDKIKKYLNDVNINPYLDKIKNNSDNLPKIQKINSGLNSKTRNGPK